MPFDTTEPLQHRYMMHVILYVMHVILADACAVVRTWLISMLTWWSLMKSLQSWLIVMTVMCPAAIVKSRITHSSERWSMQSVSQSIYESFRRSIFVTYLLFFCFNQSSWPICSAAPEELSLNKYRLIFCSKFTCVKKRTNFEMV